MPGGAPRIEYVEARRVLLDALDALRAHLGAVVLVGAQAVYLRTEGRTAGYQPFTTDADIVLDPTLLAAIPPLGDAMRNAGFVLTDEPGRGSCGPWSCRGDAGIRRRATTVPWAVTTAR